MAAIMDFPTAWAFVRATNPDDHHLDCSWRTTAGALLCDCRVLWDEYDKRKAERLASESPSPEVGE